MGGKISLHAPKSGMRLTQGAKQLRLSSYQAVTLEDATPPIRL
jgi:hypothetical protein